MSRVRLTTNNYCHKPVKGGEPVEALIDAAAEGRLEQYLAQGHSINVVTERGISALHALARAKSGSARDRSALAALLCAGINVDLVNFRGETALFRALVTKAHWVVSPLLAAGASLDVVNGKGMSLLDLAKDNGEVQAFHQARQLESSSLIPSVSRRRLSL